MARHKGAANEANRKRRFPEAITAAPLGGNWKTKTWLDSSRKTQQSSCKTYLYFPKHKQKIPIHQSGIGRDAAAPRCGLVSRQRQGSVREASRNGTLKTRHNNPKKQI